MRVGEGALISPINFASPVILQHPECDFDESVKKVGIRGRTSRHKLEHGDLEVAVVVP